MSDQIEVQREALSAALAAAGKITPWSPDPKTPPLVKLECSGGRCTLLSCNFDASIAISVPASAGNLCVAVPLPMLSGAVSKAIGDAVRLSPTPTGLLLSAARFRANLPSTLAGSYPVLARALQGPDSLLAATLREGLAQTEAATIDDNARPFLGGVYIHETPTGLAFAAMDGSRIHARAMDGSRIHAKAIVPESLVRLLLSVLPEQGDVALSVCDGRFTGDFGDTTVTGKLLNGTLESYAESLKVDSDRVLRARQPASSPTSNWRRWCPTSTTEISGWSSAR